MRLDLFVPFRKERGPVARLIGRAAPSWLWMPWRRVMQGLCLAGFLVLMFHVCRPAETLEPARAFADREKIDAEIFLKLDPLVGVSSAIAARTVGVALLWAVVVLAVGLVVPRWFCGYACPLGTLIDLFDWSAGRWVRPLHLKRRGWWTHLRYFILAAVLAAAAAGVVLSGYVAPIPVLTRGLAAIVSPTTPTHWAAAAVLIAVLLAGVLGRRFWCRCLCPTGALLSIASLLRLTERKVSAACIECGRCLEACSFDAVRPDYATRADACTFCQDCGGVCPTRAISFVGRWDRVDAARAREAAADGLSRRGFIVGVACGGVAGAAGGLGIGRRLGPAAAKFVRPPGAAPEEDFLGLCIRCGECIHACPTGILRPAGLSGGVNSLWTPRAAAEIAACDPQCNICGQVCPTGAIRPLTLEEKRTTPMGLAVVNEKTCLSWTQRQDCGRCIAVCPYEAIERRVIPTLDEHDEPIPGEDYVSPSVDADKCVGCGACHRGCHRINVVADALLAAAAIRVRPRRRRAVFNISVHQSER